MKPIDLQSLKLPYIGDLDLYRAVCSCVYRLNRGDSFKSAVKGAAEKYGVPMAGIERIVRDALPKNYFHKRQRESIKRPPMVAKLEAINRNHMASL